MTTVKELATEALSYLVVSERVNGKRYVFFNEDAPEWVVELNWIAVREVLQQNSLDDYACEWVEDALEIIVNEGVPEFQGDDYTHKLIEWLAEGRGEYVDEKVTEGKISTEPFVLIDVLREAQRLEKEEVYFSVLNYLQYLVDVNYIEEKKVVE